jgi:hypothetical protein
MFGCVADEEGGGEDGWNDTVMKIVFFLLQNKKYLRPKVCERDIGALE